MMNNCTPSRHILLVSMHKGGNLCRIFVGNIVFLVVERVWGEGFFNGGLGGVGVYWRWNLLRDGSKFISGTWTGTIDRGAKTFFFRKKKGGEDFFTIAFGRNKKGGEDFSG